MVEKARLSARIASLRELQELFSAIQALSASRVQSGHHALEGIRAYTATVERAIGAAAAIDGDAVTPPNLRRAGEAARSVLAVTSEHGFAGAYNRLVLEQARACILPNDSIGIAGRRGLASAREHGLRPDWSVSMATRLDGTIVTARRIVAKVRDYDEVLAVYGTYGGGNRFSVGTRQLLPPSPRILEPLEATAPPLHHLSKERLLKELIEEFLFAEIMLVLTESYASENAARLQVMQSANDNIVEKLNGLVQRERQLTQEAVTAELLEVVAGGDAVNARWAAKET